MNAREQSPSFFRRNLRTILGLAILALTIHDIFGPHGFLAMRRTQLEINKFSAEMQKLDRENQELADQVTSLKTDPRIIEQIAREDMGLAKPGELIFKISGGPDDVGKPGPNKDH
jgi:cell division protein FtsB|nr:septum formation initiator family protein [Candidatus Acidoferrales bacterium]